MNNTSKMVKQMTLSQKYWAPYEPVQELVKSVISKDALVVEIGPGHAPFERATEFIDWQQWTNFTDKKVYYLDLNKELLPYGNKTIDFIYCRHTLEDIYNPLWLCQEMQRVSRAGYIETPSPIAEFCRGIDGGSPPWRGYIHHRYFVWDNQGTLSFLPKYPVVEYLELNEENEIIELLNLSPVYWNTHFLWKDSFGFRLLQHDQDYKINENYHEIIREAISSSAATNFEFAVRHNIPI